MPWRFIAVAMERPCGVPSVRLPLSSSMARKTRNMLPVEQPLELQLPVVRVPPEVLQVKAAVAVERERYQSRSTVVQAEPEPGLGRSRLARSHIASEATRDSQ